MNKEQLKELIEKEGDSLQWSYACSNGVIIDCSIRRNSVKALCGYITLTQDSSLYGIEYDELNIRAHGGLTYNSYDDNNNWVIGFDCAHLYKCLLIQRHYLHLIKNKVLNLHEICKIRV